MQRDVIAPLIVAFLLATGFGCGKSAETPDTSRGSAPPAVSEQWPLTFTGGGHEVVVYQPQVDSWDDYKTISFRSALAITPKGETKTEYGVLEVTGDTETDFDNRMVRLSNQVRTFRFPGADPASAARLEKVVTEAVPATAAIDIPLDIVIACTENTPAAQASADVSFAPPTIYYSDQPAILVTLLGGPKLKPVTGTSLMFAINTNWDLFYDPASSTWFLLAGESWLSTSDAVKGSWGPAASLPAELSKLPDEFDEARKNVPGKALPGPLRVFVTTEPAEMILTDGTPEYTPVPPTQLLQVTNTSSVLLLHAQEGQHYFLVAGRWFRAKKLSGPWSAASTDLPPDFQQIPEDSPLAELRRTVKGTPEAKDAVLLASVPVRTTVKTDQKPEQQVVYEGAPEFKPITPTTVSYAINTPYDVFLVGGRYYWCLDGLWYEGSSANGPWSVARGVPPELYNIPSTHPKYNVTYVYVYESTPTTVTTGYTSGYQGEYVSNDLLVFGAGILIGAAIADDWHHCYHYGWPPPPIFFSYGMAVHYSYRFGGFYGAAVGYGPYGSAGAWRAYNPRTGTYSRGAYAAGPYGAAGWAAAYNPYTGARGYGAGVITPYGSRGGYAAYNPYTGTGSRGGVVAGREGAAYAQRAYNPLTGTTAGRAGYVTDGQAGGRGYVRDGDDWARGGYKATEDGRISGIQTSEGAGAVHVKGDEHSASVARTRSGDVYVGKDGNVYKKDEGGWQQYSGSGSWNSVDTQARTRAESPSTSVQPTASSTSGSAPRAGSQNIQWSNPTASTQGQARTAPASPQTRPTTSAEPRTTRDPAASALGGGASYGARPSTTADLDQASANRSRAERSMGGRTGGTRRR
jgi:hypothetical protein